VPKVPEENESSKDAIATDEPDDEKERRVK
jgi:hypothetical protein